MQYTDSVFKLLKFPSFKWTSVHIGPCISALLLQLSECPLHFDCTLHPVSMCLQPLLAVGASASHMAAATILETMCRLHHIDVCHWNGQGCFIWVYNFAHGDARSHHSCSKSLCRLLLRKKGVLLFCSSCSRFLWRAFCRVEGLTRSKSLRGPPARGRNSFLSGATACCLNRLTWKIGC